MLRAFFRRLPLLASLVVLVSVALFSGGPTARAASQAVSPVCQTGLGDNYQHCYVALNITAPLYDPASGVSNVGISSDMQIFNPPVGKKDEESLAQMTAILCFPDLSCVHPSEVAVLEFGWLVDPNLPWTYPVPTTAPASATHLFVYVRVFNIAANTHTACLVQYDKPGGGWNGQGWTCGWNSNYQNGSLDYPGEVLQAGTSGHFVIVYSWPSWWLGYNGNWIGNIDGSWLGSGSIKFISVGEANWQGEVALNQSINSPTSQLGNGTCGTNASKSAHISNMQLTESGFWYTALDPLLSPKTTITYSKFYNGYAYGTSTNSGEVSTLTYGGPIGCH